MKVTRRIKQTISRSLFPGPLGNLYRRLAFVRQRDITALALRCSTAELLARQYGPQGFNRLDVLVMYLALGEAAGRNDIGFSLLAKLHQRDPTRRKGDRALKLFLQAADPSRELFTPQPDRIDSEMNLAASAVGLALALFKGEPAVEVTLGGKWQPTDYDAAWFRRHGFTADEIATLEQVRQQLFDDLGLPSLPRDDLEQLHEEMRRLLNSEPQKFGRHGFYQSCEELLVPGQRPTALRFRAYGLPRLLDGTERVLDIGCNCGFFALATARHAAAVDAFDIKPSLICIAKLAQQHLGIANCNFSVCGFEEFAAPEPYDLILSFAVHQWIGMPIPEYAARLRQMLKPGGRILIESHDLKNEHDWEAKVAEFREAGYAEVQGGSICDDGIVTRRFTLLEMVPTGGRGQGVRSPADVSLAPV